MHDTSTEPSNKVFFYVSEIGGDTLYKCSAWTVEDKLAKFPRINWKKIAEEDAPHLAECNPPDLEETDEIVILMGNDNGPLMSVDHRVEHPTDPFNQPWA